MENNPSKLHESLWRKPLSGAERAKLRTQPELELEARLTAALAKMPDAPVPSNFTTRLLEVIESEAQRSTRSYRWNWRALFPRLAVAAAVLIFAGISIQRYETSSHRQEIARRVAAVASTSSQPSVEALENLDAIMRMSQSAHADGDLLAAMQ